MTLLAMNTYNCCANQVCCSFFYALHMQAGLDCTNWETYYKFGITTFFRPHIYLPTMRLYNIITQTQTQSSSLPSWFCCKEWLKDFVNHFLRDAVAIVLHSYFN